MLSSPLSPQDITPEWLTTCLNEQGVLNTGSSIEDIQWHPIINVWSGTLSPFSIQYNLDSLSLPKKLIFKHWHEQNKPVAKHELYFSVILAPFTPQIQVPRLYYADDQNINACAIYQDFTVDYDVAEPDTNPHSTRIHHILDTMAFFHAYWWDNLRITDTQLLQMQGGPLRFAHISSGDILQKYQQQIVHQKAKQLSNFSEFPQQWLSTFEWALDNWYRLVKIRSHHAKNLTLIHGDLHWHNLALHKSSSDILIFDWETHKRGLGAYDIAYFLHDTLWGDNRKQHEASLVAYYYDRLVQFGVKTYSWETMIEDYRLSMIMILLGHLQWRDMGLQHNKAYIQDAIDGFYLWECEKHFES